MELGMLELLVLLGTAAAPPQAPKPPQAPPVRVEKCGPAGCDQCRSARDNPAGCTCKDCPHPVPKPMARVKTDADVYAECLEAVRRHGGNVVLSVGVPDPPEYTYKFHVGSGFQGMIDGVYDCYMAAGTPSFSRRVPAVAVPLVSAPVPVTAAPSPPALFSKPAAAACYYDPKTGRWVCPYNK